MSLNEIMNVFVSKYIKATKWFCTYGQWILKCIVAMDSQI